MGFFSNFFGKNKNSKALSDEEIIEAGACPNCWGHNEYDGRFNQALADQTKSNTSGNKLNKKAFIQQFIEDNLTGIRLKKDGDRQSCPVCKNKHKLISSHTN